MSSLVVLAAGLGRRFGGGSRKQVAGLGPAGETLLEYAVHDALAAGFERLLCVIRPDMQSDFERALGARLRRHIALDYAHQRLDDLPAGLRPPPDRQRPWGTGHALWACRDQLDGAFGLINADDFYGAESYRILAAALAGHGPSPVADLAPPARWQLVTFSLGRCLSPGGPVSRGVCQVAPDGRLLRIVEREGIRRRADGHIRADDGRQPAELAPDTPVSMNMWGLDEGVFPFLEQSLTALLTDGRDLERAELFLPQVVAEAMAGGQARVQTHPSPASWLGLTHPEDAERVRAGLARHVDRGDYPSPLLAAEDEDGR